MAFQNGWPAKKKKRTSLMTIGRCSDFKIELLTRAQRDGFAQRSSQKYFSLKLPNFPENLCTVNIKMLTTELSTFRLFSVK